MAISVLNTDAGLSGKTIVNLEDGQTVTGLKTFDRDPNPPFAVSGNSAVVPNLDADSVDGAHYSTGTWTPALAGSGGQSGQAYATQAGAYIKIGLLVYATGRLTMSTLGTVTGTARISGLPFTSGATYNAPVLVPYFNNLTTSVASFGGYVENSATVISLTFVPAAGATGINFPAQGDLSNTFDIMFSVVYKAAA